MYANAKKKIMLNPKKKKKVLQDIAFFSLLLSVLILFPVTAPKLKHFVKHFVFG